MDDLISKQQAIRWVKTECNPYGKPTLEFESGKKVIEHLEQMPSAQPEWIPCSERLPEESGQYIITVKYVHVDGYEDLYAEHGEWDGDRWDMFCFGHCGEVEDIIAWMPLPEPYKEATL